MARMILSMLGVALVILAVGCGSGSKHYTEEERARGEHCLDRVEGYIREDIQDGSTIPVALSTLRHTTQRLPRTLTLSCI